MPRLKLLALVLFSGSLFLSACGRPPAADRLASVEPAELMRQIEAGEAPLILDVRSPGEFAEGRVPGAVNIPFDEVAARVEEIRSSANRPVVVYCRSGRRAGIAADSLAARGFTDLRHLEGDMPGWERAGHPVER